MRQRQMRCHIAKGERTKPDRPGLEIDLPVERRQHRPVKRRGRPDFVRGAGERCQFKRIGVQPTGKRRALVPVPCPPGNIARKPEITGDTLHVGKRKTLLVPDNRRGKYKTGSGGLIFDPARQRRRRTEGGKGRKNARRRNIGAALEMQRLEWIGGLAARSQRHAADIGPEIDLIGLVDRAFELQRDRSGRRHAVIRVEPQLLQKHAPLIIGRIGDDIEPFETILAVPPLQHRIDAAAAHSALERQRVDAQCAVRRRARSTGNLQRNRPARIGHGKAAQRQQSAKALAFDMTDKIALHIVPTPGRDVRQLPGEGKARTSHIFHFQTWDVEPATDQRRLHVEAADILIPDPQPSRAKAQADVMCRQKFEPLAFAGQQGPQPVGIEGGGVQIGVKVQPVVDLPVTDIAAQRRRCEIGRVIGLQIRKTDRIGSDPQPAPRRERRIAACRIPGGRLVPVLAGGQPLGQPRKTAAPRLDASGKNRDSFEIAKFSGNRDLGPPAKFPARRFDAQNAVGQRELQFSIADNGVGQCECRNRYSDGTVDPVRTRHNEQIGEGNVARRRPRCKPAEQRRGREVLGCKIERKDGPLVPASLRRTVERGAAGYQHEIPECRRLRGRHDPAIDAQRTVIAIGAELQPAVAVEPRCRRKLCRNAREQELGRPVAQLQIRRDLKRLAAGELAETEPQSNRHAVHDRLDLGTQRPDQRCRNHLATDFLRAPASAVLTILVDHHTILECRLFETDRGKRKHAALRLGIRQFERTPVGRAVGQDFEIDLWPNDTDAGDPDVAGDQWRQGHLRIDFRKQGHVRRQALRRCRHDPNRPESHVRGRQDTQMNIAIDAHRRTGNLRGLRLDLATELVPVDQIGPDESREQKRDDQPCNIGQDRIQNCLQPRTAEAPPPGGFHTGRSWPKLDRLAAARPRDATQLRATYGFGRRKYSQNRRVPENVARRSQAGGEIRKGSPRSRQSHTLRPHGRRKEARQAGTGPHGEDAGRQPARDALQRTG